MLTFPQHLEDILKRYLKQTFYQGTRRAVFATRPFGPPDLDFFAEGAKTLSMLFTSDRSDLPAHYLNDKKLRAGYLLYFLPLNFCKARFVLEKLPTAFFRKKHFKILDLGCGPGTFPLAFLDLLYEKTRETDPLSFSSASDSEETPKRQDSISVEIFALDQNSQILKDAEALQKDFVSILNKNLDIKVRFIGRSLDLRRTKKKLNRILPWGPSMGPP